MVRRRRRPGPRGQALVPCLQAVWPWGLHTDPGWHAIAFHFSGWYPWAEGPGTRARLLPYGLFPLVCLIALLLQGKIRHLQAQEVHRLRGVAQRPDGCVPLRSTSGRSRNLGFR